GLKARIEQTREVRTYAELWEASAVVFKAGLQKGTVPRWQFLSSILLTAFAFEAYLNHVEPKVVKGWKKLEKKRLSPKVKLDLICEVLEIELPKRPRQTIKKLIKFRNTLAHGRSGELEAPTQFVPVTDIDQHFKQNPLRTDWQMLIKDKKFAERAR